MAKFILKNFLHISYPSVILMHYLSVKVAVEGTSVVPSISPLFQGYSFIAPSVLFTDNVFTALDSQLACGVTSCPSLRVSPLPLPLSGY